MSLDSGHPAERHRVRWFTVQIIESGYAAHLFCLLEWWREWVTIRRQRRPLLEESVWLRSGESDAPR